MKVSEVRERITIIVYNEMNVSFNAMRTPPPPLLPIFRSDTQARLLSQLFLGNEKVSLRRLSEETGSDRSTVARECDRLENAGILRSYREGNVRLVEPNDESPYFEPLKQLVWTSFGAVSTISTHLERVQEIDEAYIYGSWAARYLGIEGPAPADIDVLVVGSPSRLKVLQATTAAAKTLSQEVNSTILDSESWNSANSGFVATIKSSPLVPLMKRGRS